MMNRPYDMYRKGGLKDEGGEIDEVSGNEVPVGGTKKGVRDDIAANLSEGEFVMPEDATRYHGLKTLMGMRQEAKAGLKQMEAMGLMGNADEATLPDDIPFGLGDLIVVEVSDDGMEKEVNMAVGGMAAGQEGETVSLMGGQQPVPVRQRPQPKVTFDEIMGDAKIEFKEYRNAEGQSLMVPFIGGTPMYPIPEGYTLYTGDGGVEEPAVPEVPTTGMEQFTDSDDDRPSAITQQQPKSIDWESLSDADFIETANSRNGFGRNLVGAIASMMNPLAGLAINGLMRYEDQKVLEMARTRLANLPANSPERAKYEKLIKSYEARNGGLFGGIINKMITKVGDLLGLDKEQTKQAKVNNMVSHGKNNPAGPNGQVTSEAIESVNSGTVTDPSTGAILTIEGYEKAIKDAESTNPNIANPAKEKLINHTIGLAGSELGQFVDPDLMANIQAGAAGRTPEQTRQDIVNSVYQNVDSVKEQLDQLSQGQQNFLGYNRGTISPSDELIENQRRTQNIQNLINLGMDEAVATASADISAVRGDLGNAVKTISDLQSSVTKAQEGMASQISNLVQQDVDFALARAAVEKNVQDLSDTVDDQIASIGVSLGLTNEAITNLINKNTTVEETLGTLVKDFDVTVEGAKQTLLDSFELMSESSAEQIATLINEVETAEANRQKTIDDLIARDVDRGLAIAAVDKNLTELSESLGEKIGSIAESANLTKEEIATLKENSDSLSKLVGTYGASVNNYLDVVDTLREDVSQILPTDIEREPVQTRLVSENLAEGEVQRQGEFGLTPESRAASTERREAGTAIGALDVSDSTVTPITRDFTTDAATVAGTQITTPTTQTQEQAREKQVSALVSAGVNRQLAEAATPKVTVPDVTVTQKPDVFALEGPEATVGPPLRQPAGTVTSVYEPTPTVKTAEEQMKEVFTPTVTTTKGVGAGRDVADMPVTPEQRAYASAAQEREDPYDPRNITQVPSEQVTNIPVTTTAQIDTPSLPEPVAPVAPPTTEPSPVFRPATSIKPATIPSATQQEEKPEGLPKTETEKLAEQLAGTKPTMDTTTIAGFEAEDPRAKGPVEPQQPAKLKDVVPETPAALGELAKPKETFSDAFAEARKAGKETFTFEGKSFTTETKEEKQAREAKDDNKTQVTFNPKEKDTSGTTKSSVVNTTAVNKTGSDVTIGQKSSTGQDAGDGFVWEKKEGTNALTRKWVGTSNDNDSGGSDDGGSGGGSSDSGGCCFIMLEARYGDGTMDEVVRRYRDEHMTDRNRRGYYKVAEVLVPLMRKSPVIKWLVTKTFADPLVSYGKYYYGQNKHGVLYSPVKSLWMKLFDTVGGDTEFIRENGEVV